MDNSLHYLELCNNPIRFDPVSQMTNVFFDDSNRQVFAVRSGGATGITVKGPSEFRLIKFCMKDKGAIRSIKFSPDNRILAIQRTELVVEFIHFIENQPNLNDILITKEKSAEIYGFVWVHFKEVALISNCGIELHSISLEKKQLKCVKQLSLTLNWFAWCPTGSFALLSSNNGTILTPVVLKQGTITKLPRLELESDKSILECDVTLAQLYDTSAILILRQTPNRLVEVVIYLLNGPGLAPRKAHILKLGHSGRFAMNIVDDLVVVHHQASATSMIFDIAISGEIDPVTGVVIHSPISLGKSLKPFNLKLPSIPPDEKTMQCELYSKNWVLFQPNVVIDAKLGCLWYLNLKIDPLCTLVTDKVCLVEFLLNRTNGKEYLLSVLKGLVNDQNNVIYLPIFEKIFDKLNEAYKLHLDDEIKNQMGTLSTAKVSTSKSISLPRVKIDQYEMCIEIFLSIPDSDYLGKILMIYLLSLLKHKIAAQDDLSKLIIMNLVTRRDFDTLQQLLNYSLLGESKPLACFLLSLGNVNSCISQMALDMLSKLKADEIIIEVLLGQGKIIDALRLGKQLPGNDLLSARKYLEAAQKLNDPIVYHSVYQFFQQRNIRLRNTPDFSKNEQCNDYIQHYQNLFNKT